MRTSIPRLLLVLLLALSLTAQAFAGSQATSGTTVATVITRAQEDVNDASANFFDDDEGIRWADEAVTIIASQARCIEGTENATLRQGQMTYPLATSHYDIETVVYDSGVSTDPQRYTFLNKVDPKELYALSKEKGRPTYWWEWGGSINVWPVPGADQNATTIMVSLVEKPAAITATNDTLPTPYYFDPAIVSYMKSKYLEKDERATTAAYYRGLFYSAIEYYLQTIRKRLMQEPAQ
ncbi:MAG: hypothetical protein M0R22_12290 [Dehalococcoidia bacterium]|jgi:hypothetical protein|nr:hypothetical protein [Dehalococcoidia bacterium]